MYSLEFEIAGLPPTTNGSHGGWRSTAAVKKKWRRLTEIAVASTKPAEPLNKVRVTFTRYSSQEPDDDNLAISFKSIRDGLKHAGVIVDDAPKNLSARYFWERVKVGQGKVKVFIEEV